MDTIGLTDPLAPTTANASAASGASMPHPVRLDVAPRFVDDRGRPYEADYTLTVTHPAGCPDTAAGCPMRDYLNHVGIDENLFAGFPAPDHLTDEDLAALDGTVRFVTVTRRTEPEGGGEYAVFYNFDWNDQH